MRKHKGLGGQPRVRVCVCKPSNTYRQTQADADIQTQANRQQHALLKGRTVGCVPRALLPGVAVTCTHGATSATRRMFSKRSHLRTDAVRSRNHVSSVGVPIISRRESASRGVCGSAL